MQTDKLKHLISGYLIALISLLFAPPLLAFGLGCLAGLVKDVIWDLWLKKGCFEWADIIITCVGAAAGVLPAMVNLI
jgi:hypothetical protein